MRGLARDIAGALGTLGHVTALGSDLERTRARAVAAARYLADGVVDPAFAFDPEH